MEIDGVDIARGHGRKFEAFARRVGAGEIQTQMVAHHEADDRQRDVFLGAHADAHDDARRRFKQIGGLPAARQASRCRSLPRGRRRSGDRCWGWCSTISGAAPARTTAARRVLVRLRRRR